MTRPRTSDCKLPKSHSSIFCFMDLELLEKGFGRTQKRGKWVLLLAALGFTGYGVYNVYHLPSVVKKRKRVLKLLGTLISIAEAVSNSAEAVGVLSKDLKVFVQSDSDRIPKSFRQVSKIARSEEFSESVVRVTRALTVGISRGCRSDQRKDDGMSDISRFLDLVSDKLFSTAGSGFASVVVGSFARNLVVAYSDVATIRGFSESGLSSAPDWVNLMCSGKSRELIGDCIQLFVSTAVSVYLDKTMHINPYDELFSGLTNPKHETKMKDMVASVCNGAVETLVKTTRKVLTSSDSDLKSDSSNPYSGIDEFESQTTVNGEFLGEELLSTELEARNSFDENEDDNGWVNKMASILAVLSNRDFVLDLTGRVTFETVRSFLNYLLEKLCDGMRSSVSVAHEVVVGRVLEVVGLVTAKSSAVVTMCVSLCLQILGGVWILVPA